MKKAYAIIGSAYGDEGKGLITDYLAASDDSNTLVIRFNGGAQAGHTVQRPNGCGWHVVGDEAPRACWSEPAAGFNTNANAVPRQARRARGANRGWHDAAAPPQRDRCAAVAPDGQAAPIGNRAFQRVVLLGGQLGQPGTTGHRCWW